MRHLMAVTAVLTGVLLAGCSNESSMSMRTTGPSPAALRVSPADGATGVRLDAPVTLTFAVRMDRETVERGMHLISEPAMADPGCPEAATMPHPDMTSWMADSAMMRHLDRYHAMTGHFSWNAAGTVCAFQPDSPMAPSTRYMIHMGPEMMDMLGGSAGGMMEGHGAGMMSGHMMMHFTTLDAGTHDGHH